MKKIILTLIVFFVYNNLLLSQYNPKIVTLNDNIRYEIELPKREYKRYEPIVALCRYINDGNSADTVYYLFGGGLGQYAQFYILNDSGEVFSNRTGVIGCKAYDMFTAIVLPGDTLIKSFNIHNSFIYRKELQNSAKGRFIDYLEPGNYFLQGYIEIDHMKKYDPPLLTDTIAFTVTEIDNDDLTALNIHSEKNYITKNSFKEMNMWGEPGTVYLDYDNNISIKSVFNEYFFLALLSQKINAYIAGNITKEGLIDFSNLYMEKFPNSLLGLETVLWYIKTAYESMKDTEAEMDRIVEKYPGTYLAGYLSNGFVRRSTLNGFSYRPDYHWVKNRNINIRSQK